MFKSPRARLKKAPEFLAISGLLLWWPDRPGALVALWLHLVAVATHRTQRRSPGTAGMNAKRPHSDERPAAQPKASNRVAITASARRAAPVKAFAGRNPDGASLPFGTHPGRRNTLPVGPWPGRAAGMRVFNLEAVVSAPRLWSGEARVTAAGLKPGKH